MHHVNRFPVEYFPVSACPRGRREGSSDVFSCRLAIAAGILTDISIHPSLPLIGRHPQTKSYSLGRDSSFTEPHLGILRDLCARYCVFLPSMSSSDETCVPLFSDSPRNMSQAEIARRQVSLRWLPTKLSGSWYSTGSCIRRAFASHKLRGNLHCTYQCSGV